MNEGELRYQNLREEYTNDALPLQQYKQYTRTMANQPFAGQLLSHPSPYVRNVWTLWPITQSIKEIEAVPFTGKERKRIEDRINRYEKLGVKGQALVLENELKTRDALLRMREWDYKVLPEKDLAQFRKTQDGLIRTTYRPALKIHIERLEAYTGDPSKGEAKDRLIPDNVLDELDKAEERQLFDYYEVLWAEEVRDPLLLGKIDGCADYFLIAEWGDDITFNQIKKGDG